jgi:sec-independent protein translocase protein TatA
MGELSVWHWLLVGAVAAMLFGVNRLPDMARSAGRSLRIFQAEMRGIQNDGGTSVVDGVAEPAEPARPADGPAGPGGTGPDGGAPRPGAQ